MSKLSLIRDVQFQRHITPDSHPERPQRLAAIDRAFAKTALDNKIKELQPRSATQEEIAEVHHPGYVERLEKDAEHAKDGKLFQLDSDTFMSEESFVIAKLAAGAGLVAIDSIASGESNTSFVAVRPPGHHALYDSSMGFCLFNNIAVTAKYAQKKLGVKRILIIDWDVHHGNGTQAMFYDDPSVLFMSFHQYPFWPPDSGWLTEDGIKEGRGYNINIPLPAGTGDRGYLSAWDRIVEPIAMEYSPELILLSAGYDAHVDDPLGQQLISTNGFKSLTEKLMTLAKPHGGKVVSFLEGGYDTTSLAASAIATMQVLNADEAAGKSDSGGPSSQPLVQTRDHHPGLVDERIGDLRKHFSKYWQELR